MDLRLSFREMVSSRDMQIVAVDHDSLSIMHYSIFSANGYRAVSQKQKFKAISNAIIG